MNFLKLKVSKKHKRYHSIILKQEKEAELSLFDKAIYDYLRLTLHPTITPTCYYKFVIIINKRKSRGIE